MPFLRSREWSMEILSQELGYTCGRECCNLEAAKRKTTRKLVRIGFEWRSLHTILKSPITIASMIPLSKFHDQNRFLSKKRLGWNYHFSLIKL